MVNRVERGLMETKSVRKDKYAQTCFHNTIHVQIRHCLKELFNQIETLKTNNSMVFITYKTLQDNFDLINI